MADDAGTRLRNVSPYGPVDVPELGVIVEFHHEVVVADPDRAARLVESGHFTAVAKPGPKPADSDAAGAPESTATPDPAATAAEPTPTGADAQ